MFLNPNLVEYFFQNVPNFDFKGQMYKQKIILVRRNTHFNLAFFQYLYDRSSSLHIFERGEKKIDLYF
jgi:hypothetical protein